MELLKRKIRPYEGIPFLSAPRTFIGELLRQGTGIGALRIAVDAGKGGAAGRIVSGNGDIDIAANRGIGRATLTDIVLYYGLPIRISGHYPENR